ncbi:MAG: SpoIIE family protein phosphatase [Mycobacterium sp.]|nr:SpoIIE family protein phosphatase [Mycobacterium sp.]
MRGDVVVVDDEVDTLKLLKVLLESDGYRVRALTSGSAALRSIATDTPDLVLLDIRMPGMSGFEVCEELKADPASRSVPVIFLSAATDVEDKIKAFRAGGVDYVTKPFEREEVLSRVATHVSLFRARAEINRMTEALHDSEQSLRLAQCGGPLCSREPVGDDDAAFADLRVKAAHLAGELDSAARYVGSTLPGGLVGPVQVRSSCVPSREIGGDSYYYQWIDDDHLIVYLIDVSGHGVESAMVSMTVHNVLRSGTIEREILLDPAAMLASLNRLFPMEQHDGNYFTAWYGVYRASDRTLSYSSAGHPPAMAFVRHGTAVRMTDLATDTVPVGVFPDTTFQTKSFAVPTTTDILIYSDGAFELMLNDGRRGSMAGFTDLCVKHFETARRPDEGPWSLESLVAELRAGSLTGRFDDDCTLVALHIP